MGKDSGGNGGVIINMSSATGICLFKVVFIWFKCDEPKYKFLLCKNINVNLSLSSLKKFTKLYGNYFTSFSNVVQFSLLFA